MGYIDLERTQTISFQIEQGHWPIVAVTRDGSCTPADSLSGPVDTTWTSQRAVASVQESPCSGFLTKT